VICGKGKTICSPNLQSRVINPGKQTITKCFYSWALWQLMTVLCHTDLSTVICLQCDSRHNPPCRGAHNQQGVLRSTRLVQDSQNTQEEQDVLSTTRGSPGPVKWPARKDHQGSAGDLQESPQILPRKSVKGYIPVNKFFTPCTKLLDVIQSYKYLLLKYRNCHHFENEMSWKLFFIFQVPGNGITVNWIIMVRNLSLEQELSSCHRRINSP
jgi:hypothetical protein